jgi:hypothetical protein
MLLIEKSENFIRFDAAIRPGTIGAARLVRQYAQLSQSGDVVDVEAFDPNTLGSDVYLASMDLEVSADFTFFLRSPPAKSFFVADSYS